MTKIKFGNPLKGVQRCPQCNVASPLLELRWTSRSDENGLGVSWCVFECSSCQRFTLAEGHAAPLQNGTFTAGSAGHSIKTFYPAAKTVDANLPTDAQRYLRQAIETKFAPDASIVMAASAVDSMLRGKGYRDGSLYVRIEKAVEDRVLTEGMAAWAHRVRLEANSVRHVDEDVMPPTEEDAHRVIEFASALGDFMYVFEARVAEGLRGARGGE